MEIKNNYTILNSFTKRSFMYAIDYTSYEIHKVTEVRKDEFSHYQKHEHFNDAQEDILAYLGNLKSDIERNIKLIKKMKETDAI